MSIVKHVIDQFMMSYLVNFFDFFFVIVSSLLFWAGIVPNVDTSIVRRLLSVYMTNY